MSESNPAAVANAMRVFADVLDGAPPIELTKALLRLALSLAPVGILRQYLDEEDKKRDDAIADAAEAAKVGDGP